MQWLFCRGVLDDGVSAAAGGLTMVPSPGVDNVMAAVLKSQQLVADVQSFMIDNRLSNTAVCRLVKITPSVLTQWLSGRRYKTGGINAKLDFLMRAWLQLQRCSPALEATTRLTMEAAAGHLTSAMGFKQCMAATQKLNADERSPLQSWDAEEEKELVAMVARHGAGNWSNISAEFSTCRSTTSIRQRWNRGGLPVRVHLVTDAYQ